MARRRYEECVSRLERMEARGDFDVARAALDGNPPALAELGLDAGAARRILATPVRQLESALGVGPGLLEAIVRLTTRPSLLVQNGAVTNKPSLVGLFPAGIDVKVAKVEPLLASIGRIEFVNHDLEWGGTGWVVAQEADGQLLVVTNRHVARLVAYRTERGDGVFMSGMANIRYGAEIDFVEEADAPEDLHRVLTLAKFTYLADDAAADVALARVRAPSADAGFAVAPLPLAEKDGETDETVAVVGYPARDSRNDAAAMERYFKGLYNVKRFAPGLLMAPTGPRVLGHDCTTLGGNSGSPVISLDSGHVVGLHFAGVYGEGNSAVRVSTLRSLIDSGASGDVHLAAAFRASEAGTETVDGQHDAGHFAGRPGYDPGFLGVALVPLPVIPVEIPLAVPSDASPERPHELRYRHFGILYSAALKCPVIAALNIDGARTRAVKRTDRWFRDLRLPADSQLGVSDFADAGIDRGHLIQRAATNWGDDDTTAREADGDSFHYTAVCPQHIGLNRNQGTWLGLERYIMDSARTHGFRATVFTGPVLAGDLSELPDLGTTGAKVPREFFKVVAMAAEAEAEGEPPRLHATAYVLSQGQLIQELLIEREAPEAAEGFVFGAFRTFQIRVRDLEARTGYNFGPLRDADPLDRLVAREAAGEGPALRPAIPLEALDGIVL